MTVSIWASTAWDMPGSADEGEDIARAGIPALVINTINSIAV